MKNTISKLISHSASCILHFFFFLLSSAFLILSSQFAAAQEIEWQNTIGGNWDDVPYTIEQTNDGGYILGGYSYSDSTGDKVEPNLGGTDCWILKIDSLGNIEWQKTIGGISDDVVRIVHQMQDGGYIIGAYSRSDSSQFKTENSMGGCDLWILRLNSNGNILWQNTIGGNNDDYLASINTTNDMGFILGGISNSNISGDKTENCLGYQDYWVVKIDSLGDIEWQKTLGATGYDYLNNVLQTSDGGYIVAGYRFTVMWNQYNLIKLDSSGNVQWEKLIGGSLNDELGAFKLTSDGGYILGGASNSNASGDKTENRYGTYDYWVIKTDSIGNKQWDNTIGGTAGCTLTSIEQTTDFGYVIGGYSDSDIKGDKTENRIGGKDVWILKIDSVGSVLWQNTIGTFNDDYISSIASTATGQVIACWTNSDALIDKKENSMGGKDFWIIKLTSNFNQITGSSYVDINGDAIKNVNEAVNTNQKITEQTTGCLAFTQQNGNYYLAVLDSGTFTVAPSLSSINYYNPVPVTHTATFTGINQIDSLNDFAFQPTGVFNDLCVTITPTGPFRIGFNASYVISYQNVGTTNLSGNVIFFPWSNVTYTGANVTPTSISADSIVWNTGILNPFQSGSITITVAVNVGLPIGTLINSSVRIEPVANDANPGCNYHNWEVYTIGSYDPNDILVSEDTILTTQLPSAPWLDYTIRFQNTGNDTAFTVKVINPIDTNFLNLSTIEFVNSSHPVNINYIPWERNMQFTFNNILLPDSNINEPLSHGFVHYRIKPKTTLQSGNSILNNAFIYFDFNVPVATNTVSTLITNPTSIFNIQHSIFNIKIVPNPSKDEITISGYHLNKGASADVKIVDVMGKEVYNTSVTTLNIKLQTLNFSSGVYFVEVSSSNSISRARFVKQ